MILFTEKHVLGVMCFVFIISVDLPLWLNINPKENKSAHAYYQATSCAAFKRCRKIGNSCFPLSWILETHLISDHEFPDIQFSDITLCKIAGDEDHLDSTEPT